MPVTRKRDIVYLVEVYKASPNRTFLSYKDRVINFESQKHRLKSWCFLRGQKVIEELKRVTAGGRQIKDLARGPFLINRKDRLRRSLG